MRDTIASGIGSLLAVIASHVRRPITSRTDALHCCRTRVPTGTVTDSGEDRKIRAGRRVRGLWLVAPLVIGLSLIGHVNNSLAQTINFYHGTDCETAHTIAQNPVRPYQAGSLIESGQGVWTRYTDF